MNIKDRLINSLDNHSEGFSLRKVVSIILLICIVYIHLKYVSEANAIEAMIIDLIGAAFFLGLVTFGQILELKNGKNNENQQQGS